MSVPAIDNSNGTYLKSIIPIADMLEKGYVCPTAMNNDILHKVEYTSDSDKLYPRLITHEDDKFSILNFQTTEKPRKHEVSRASYAWT